MPSRDNETSRNAADLPARVRLVLLFGGRSAEHEISCISASHVLAAVDPDRYDVVPVGITRDGRFVGAEHSKELVAAGEEVMFEQTIDPDHGCTEVVVDPQGPTSGPLEPTNADPTPDQAIPTVVLPILHGPNGEDGTIQGVLEIAGVPYVGSGVLSSAVAMDKDMAKTVMAAKAIPQTPWHTVRSHNRPDDTELQTFLDDLGPVLFVKPANMGSSIGVSRVEARTGTGTLDRAIDEALRYDDVVVIEAGVEGRELECAVLGNEEPRASVLGEVVTGADFYDYEDKYFDGSATTVIPAELDAPTMTAGQELAVRTFEALRCTGMARVDMFLRDDGELLVNEVNTIPGFTPISMYPKLWEASGLSYSALVDELVALALRAHERRTSRSVAP